MSEIGLSREQSEDDLPPYIKINRKYCTRVSGEKFAESNRRFFEGVDNNYILDQWTDWEEADKKDISILNPRVMIPVELPSQTSDRIDVVRSVPYVPYANRENQMNLIIAAGMNKVGLDDPTQFHDDAIRFHSHHLNTAKLAEDADAATKIQSWLSENGVENGIAVASNFVSLLKIAPPLTVPFIGLRAIINGRKLIYKNAHRFDHRIKKLQDPDVFAGLMRVTKPLRMKTDDHELQDSLVLLKTPEIVEYLQDNGYVKADEVDKKVLAIADSEHASGENYWNDYAKQVRNFSEVTDSLIDIRLEFAKLEEEPLDAGDWNQFGQELIEHFASVRIFGVDTRPPHPSIAAVTHQIPILHTFTSKRIERIIQKKIDRTVAFHVDEYPNSGVNDF